MAKVNRLRKVNVYAKNVVKGTTYPPLRGLHMGIMMSDKDIEICLAAGAKVYEVKHGNKTMELTKPTDKVVENATKFVSGLSDEELEILTRPDGGAMVKTESQFIESESGNADKSSNEKTKEAESSETI